MSSGSSRATNVPDPRRAARYPSANNCSYASSVVVRETRRSSASFRDDGSRTPGARVPSRIARRTAKYTCCCSPSRARVSILIRSPSNDCTRWLFPFVLLITLLVVPHFAEVVIHFVSELGKNSRITLRGQAAARFGWLLSKQTSSQCVQNATVKE